jgi:hypothetical protein
MLENQSFSLWFSCFECLIYHWFIFLFAGDAISNKWWCSVYLGKPFSCIQWSGILIHAYTRVIFMKAIQNINFRGLWYGRKSCKSLWSSCTQVLGTLYSYQFSCNDFYLFFYFLFQFYRGKGASFAVLVLKFIFFIVSL